MAGAEAAVLRRPVPGASQFPMQWPIALRRPREARPAASAPKRRRARPCGNRRAGTRHRYNPCRATAGGFGLPGPPRRLRSDPYPTRSARGGYGSNRIAEAALAGLPDAARKKLTWAIAMPASCSPASTRPGSTSPGGRCRRMCFATAGGGHPPRPRLAGAPRPVGARTAAPGAGDGVQPHRALESPRNAARARLQRRRSADRGCERAALRIDRTMFHVAASANPAGARLRLGRVADILPNDPDFAPTEALSPTGAPARHRFRRPRRHRPRRPRRRAVPLARKADPCCPMALARAVELRSTKRGTTGGP